MVAGEGGLSGIHAVLCIACRRRFDFSDGLLPDRFDLEWLLPQWAQLAMSVYVPLCTSCLLMKGRLKLCFQTALYIAPRR